MRVCDVCGSDKCGTYHSRADHKFSRKQQIGNHFASRMKRGKSVPKEILSRSESTGRPIISPKKLKQYIDKHL